MNPISDMKLPLLEVMICTHKREGLERVSKMYLPQIEDVAYLVSCQSEPLPLPQSLQRNDVRVVFTESKGLSNNRNNALYNVMAPYALIADDDLLFDPSGLADIVRVMQEHPYVDIATFICNAPGKNVYPKTQHDLSKEYHNYNLSSCEIALRMSAIRRHGLIFTPLMGIGAKYLKAGEENAFVLSGLKQGLRGRFFPIKIASHPHESTGTAKRDDPGLLRSIGAYASLAYPWTVLLRLPLIASRAPGSKLRNLYHLVWGMVYGVAHRSKILFP